jgi:hypothetical protein
MSTWHNMLSYNTGNRAIWHYIFNTKAKQIVDMRHLNETCVKKTRKISRDKVKLREERVKKRYLH